ncbi:helix-turn-helix domain-containing protein [Carboxylicivirga mesophila]|uniref:Helix-turn-helix domain-containing protein n=1 Tax=Carboxylicivirga mesophila TaxID=1166478 RepID=A0ABS5K9V0_9BACT|nr:helix-turn-helix domain-containing protein [Carboxylicivirga mesophila]MBS2211809.1 helix-turn-helix domain-containing protein [Carboxylicivirga mesophila]
MEEHQSMDDQFISKVQDIIEQNIDNENFSVEELACQVGLSRSMLHRKLTKLTGKSASETISHVRLSRARDLLEHNVATVSETAYRVGFKSPSYFNKVFKSYYHISPGEIKKEAQAEDQVKRFQQTTVNTSVHLLLTKTRVKFIVTIITLAGIGLILLFSLTALLATPKSVAVLPLENLTGSADNDYIIDGIHDALVGELGQFSALRVISRRSTLRYKDSDMLIKDIAEELDVNTIIEGSILSAGDSIHLLIQVIKVGRKEEHLMTLDFHDSLANILSIQSKVAQAIAKKIRANISNKEYKQMQNTQIVNPELYKAYLRGMYFLHQGNTADFEEGITYLEEAIEKDPGDAFAYAGMALGYATMGHGQLDAHTAFLKAFNAANKAIKLDPTLDESYTALSLLILYQDWNWSLAASSFESALDVNPNNAVAHAHYAWYYVLFNNNKKAIEHAYQATILDPLSASFHAWLGLIYVHNHQFDKAEQSARRALDLNAKAAYGQLILGRCCLYQKKYLQAIAYHERLPKGMYWDAQRAFCYIESGQREKALEIWQHYETLAQTQPINSCYRGMMASCLGFKDDAFKYLNEAIDNKTYPITYLNFYPHSKAIKDDVRYIHLLQKMKLPYTK